MVGYATAEFRAFPPASHAARVRGRTPPRRRGYGSSATHCFANARIASPVARPAR